MRLFPVSLRHVAMVLIMAIVGGLVAKEPQSSARQSQIHDSVRQDDLLDLQYTITVDAPIDEAEQAHVRIEVQDIAVSELYFIVGQYINANDLRNHTDDAKPELSSLQARALDGTPLTVQETHEDHPYGWNGGGGWRVNTQGSTHIVLEYDRQPCRLDWSVGNWTYYYYNMIPINQEIGSIKVAFDFPDGWIPITPWNPVSDFEFEVPQDYRGLLGNYTASHIAAAKNDIPIYRRTIDGTEVVLYGHWPADAIDHTEQLLTYMHQVHGGYAYDRLVLYGYRRKILPPLWPDRLFLRKTGNTTNGLGQGWPSTDFHRGNALAYLLDSYGGEKMYSGLHELSHGWNVLQLMSGRDPGTWWHDGMGQYFESAGARDIWALDKLYGAQLYQDWDFYKSILGTQYDVSLVDAGRLALETGDRTYHNLCYFKGALLFHMLEQELAARGVSIYDLTQYVYQNFLPPTNPGTVANFEAATSLLAGEDMSDFFDRYLTGTTPYPLAALEAYDEDYQDLFVNGSLAGTVVDEESGAPVSDACIAVSSTAPEWTEVTDFCCTDSDGHYLIYGLDPGEYYLRSMVNCGQSGNPNSGYRDEWYAGGGSVADGKDATAAVVVGGDVTLNVDFELPYRTYLNLPLVARNHIHFTGPNRPPLIPSQPLPADGATEQPLTVTLTWTGSDPDGDSVTYDVYLKAGDSGSYTVACSGLTSVSCDVDTLDLDTRYYWRVDAEDSHGATTSGPVWTFTTVNNRPPHTPSDPSPAHGASDQPIDLTLHWSGGDPDPGDSVLYDVSMRIGDGAYRLPCNDATSTSCDPGSLEANTRYYWRVTAADGRGAITDGPVWEFTTGGVSLDQ